MCTSTFLSGLSIFYNRKTDITIGDFWHIEEKISDFFDSNGNSLFLVHIDSGRQLFECINDTLNYRESNTMDCWQVNLKKLIPVFLKRKKLWDNYQAKGIEYIMKKYGTVLLQTRVMNKQKTIIEEKKVEGNAAVSVLSYYSNFQERKSE